MKTLETILAITIITLTILNISSAFCQCNIIKPREKSKAFEQYYEIVKNIKVNEWEKLPLKEKQKIASLTFLARLTNPWEVYQIQKENPDPYENSFWIGDEIFRQGGIYERSSNPDKYILANIYYAPFIFEGIITQIDTIYEYPDSHFKYVIYGYEMEITEIFNQLITDRLKGREIYFLHSTGRRALNHTKFDHQQRFTQYNKYLVFLEAFPNNFFDENNGETLTALNKFPALKITKKGDEFFRIENGFIKDENEYFGLGKVAKIEEVKLKIHKKIEEILKWR